MHSPNIVTNPCYEVEYSILLNAEIRGWGNENFHYKINFENSEFPGPKSAPLALIAVWVLEFILGINPVQSRG